MTATEASGQAGILSTASGEPGDVPTPSGGQPLSGVLSTGDVTTPQQTEDATEKPAPTEEAPKVPETLAPKDKRKSDKEWQEAQEKAKVAPQLEEQLRKQQDEIERLRFERDNPVVLSQEYKEQWEAMEKDPRWAAFPRDERVKYLVKPDYSQVKQDQQSQDQKQQGSVSRPLSSEPPKPGYSSSLVAEGASWWGSEKEAIKRYDKYLR